MQKRAKRLLTAKEAADYLGISVATLNRMGKEEQLVPFRTPGGHRRYSLTMLDEYLEGSRQRPPAAPSSAKQSQSLEEATLMVSA